MKKGTLRLTVNVAHMGSREKCKKNLEENVNETDFLGDLGVEGRIILKMILHKYNGRA